MKQKLFIGAIVLMFSSCDYLDLKPLDVHTVEKGKISVRWFYTSSITTIHNHVEIQTQHGWRQVVELDGNIGRIYDVCINKDTVVVQVPEHMMVYQLESVSWGRTVRVDASVSQAEYEKKFPRPK